MEEALVDTSPRGLGFRGALLLLPLIVVPLVPLVPAGPAAGQTGWLPEQRLTRTSTLFGPNVCCAAGPGSAGIDIVWYAPYEGNSVLFHQKFDGWVWSRPELVTSNPAYASRPAVTADSFGGIHVAWQDSRAGESEIYYRPSDGGVWLPEVRLTSSPGSSQTPAIASAPDGKLHVVWTDLRDGNKEIYYKVFDGAAWTEDLRLTTDNANSIGPCVAAGPAGQVYVAWYCLQGDSFAVYFKFFDGTGWSADQRMTWDSGVAENPCLAVDAAGDVHMVWDEDRSGVLEIYHRVFDGAAWGTDESLSAGSIGASAPHIVVGAGGELDVVWHDGSPSDTTSEIHFRRFDGSAWEAQERLTFREGPSQYARLAVDGAGNRHVLWHDGRDGTFNQEVYWKWFCSGTLPKPAITSIEPAAWPADEARSFSLEGSHFVYGVTAWLERSGEPVVAGADLFAESQDRLTCALSLGCATPENWDVVVRNIDGQADTLHRGFAVEPGFWEDEVRLTEHPATARLPYSNARAIATDQAGNPHVAWFESRTGHNEIYYKRFDGFAWGPDQQLTSDGAASEYPALAMDSGGVHVVWTDNRDGDWEIYYKKWNGSWTDDLRLTAAAGHSRNPSVATEGDGKIHVVWDDKRDGNYEIYYKSFDGSVWGPDERLTTSGNGSQYASVAVGPDGRLHVVWREDFLSPDQIRYKSYDGVSWSTTEIIAPSSYNVADLSMTVDGGGMVHVVWDDTPPGYSGGPNSDVYYLRRDAAGWGPVTRLTTADLKGRWPTLAANDAGCVYVMWGDQRDGDYEIYYKLFDGCTWMPDVRLTALAGSSRQPSCALDSYGRVHMAWADSSFGDFELCYVMRQAEPTAAVAEGPDGLDSPLTLRIAPNPGRDAIALFSGSVPPGGTRLAVYDPPGRLVWEKMIQAGSPPGRGVLWNCRDRSGARVAPGIYFVYAEAAGHRVSAKVVLLR
jgi:hypothetical protein